MNLSYNITFTIAAFFVGVIVLLVSYFNYSSTNAVSRRFRYFTWATLAMYVLDVVTVITNDYGKQMPGWVNPLLNALYFFSGATVAILFLYYCLSVALREDLKRTRKTFYIINLSLLAIYAVSLALNIPFGFYFHFPDGVYTHGDAYLLVNALALSYVVEALVVFLIRRRMFNKKQIAATTLFIGLFFLAYILQVTAFPEVLLSDFGAAIGTLITLSSLETPDYVKLIATLDELNELKASLEIQVNARTKELADEKEAYGELTLETLSSLARVIDAKDHYTRGHSFRVASYARGIAKELGFNEDEQETIYLAGLIHDVGKIGIDESIIKKPGKLTPEEYAAIQAHSALGGDILKGIRAFPIFEQVARNHHERYDGKGYPDKLAGEEIPLPARIVAVADTFDAMTSTRSYRKALSEKTAIEELVRCQGTQFDPKMVEAFLKLYEHYPNGIKHHIDDFSLDIEAEEVLMKRLGEQS